MYIKVHTYTIIYEIDKRDQVYFKNFKKLFLKIYITHFLSLPLFLNI